MCSITAHLLTAIPDVITTNIIRADSRLPTPSSKALSMEFGIVLSAALSLD